MKVNQPLNENTKIYKIVVNQVYKWVHMHKFVHKFCMSVYYTYKNVSFYFFCDFVHSNVLKDLSPLKIITTFNILKIIKIVSKQKQNI